MSGAVAATTRNPWLTMAAWRRLFRDRPIIPLIGLLVVLVVILELARPGIVKAEWLATTVRGTTTSTSTSAS